MSHIASANGKAPRYDVWPIYILRLQRRMDIGPTSTRVEITSHFGADHVQDSIPYT